MSDHIPLDHTVTFIQIVHRGQVDKGGLPYHLHPIAVMNLLPKTASREAKEAALLHDVVEDTDVTLVGLRHIGYPERTIEIVDLLTRWGDDIYDNFINRIARSNNRDAIMVKLADIEHNLSRGGISESLTERYEDAQSKLRGALASAMAA